MQHLRERRQIDLRNDARKFLRAGIGGALSCFLLVTAEGTPRWFPGPQAPVALENRAWHAMVYDSWRGRVVLFGGYSPSYLWNDTWEYDGSTWVSGPTAPRGLSPRYDHAMTFDTWRGRTVMFGGFNYTTRDLGDTWEYDGNQWLPGASAPSTLIPRSSAAMAFDAWRGRVVLAGGLRYGQTLSDVWEYDGQSWIGGPSLPPALGPRGGARLQFDPVRRTTVLFGGFGYDYRSDTWEYDGASWTLRDHGTPDLLRSHVAMSYDVRIARMVFHGGRFDRISFRDVWELGPAGWVEEPIPPRDMLPRAYHGMVYDRQRERLVLYGGWQTDAFPTGRTTWERAEEDDSYVAGQGLAAANPNKVRVFDASGQPGVAFLAYGARQWGVNVASAVLFFEARGDIVTGPGPGAVYGPQARAFRRDGVPRSTVNFYAYGTLRYGVNVTGSDVDSDGFDEIITGAGPALVFGPHVRGWDVDGQAAQPIPGLSFFAYGALTYGVAVSGAEVVRDDFGYREILTGAGPGPALAPHVRGFYRRYYGQATTTPVPGLDFFAFPTHEFGAQVAGGDVDGDGHGEIACAQGSGPGLHARFRGFDFSGTAIAALPGFDVIPYPTLYGGRVALGDLDGDRREELVTGAGTDPGADATVKTFLYNGTILAPSAVSFVAFTSNYGVNVSTGALAR